MPLLVHGDAAFAGQGVVAETLNLSQLRGYRTGGTIHVVINNQVGFTTSPGSSRSTLYCTDVARMVQAPIFHVNGDDPEACVRVAKLAFDYRQAFKKDVVIDMVCYRRRGHNEGDDPSMTQPLMYNLIEAKRSVRKLYTESLIGRGDITVEEAEKALQDFSSQLEHVFNEVRELEKHQQAVQLVVAVRSRVMRGLAPQVRWAIVAAVEQGVRDARFRTAIGTLRDRKSILWGCPVWNRVGTGGSQYDYASNNGYTMNFFTYAPDDLDARITLPRSFEDRQNAVYLL